jgi:hypothetical protein
MSREDEKIERIDAEVAFDIYRVCELLSTKDKKITPETHWFRVTHEVTRDAAPWAMFRVQAIRRS